MGNHVFRLPDVGEGIAEAEIVKWHVKAGDEVSEGQPLADVMTDKATVEIAAPVSGLVRSTTGEEGSKLAVGAELAVFETAATQAVRERAVPTPKPEVATLRPSPGKILASPAVRARAKALAIDLTTVHGQGPGGRIEHADLDRLLSKAPAEPSITPVLGPPQEGTEDIKVFGLRRRIAERMLDSKRRVPHFTYVEEVDVTALEDLRKTLNAQAGIGTHLTVLPFVIRAIIAALGKHPGINSHYDDAQALIRRFKPVHAGIATQTERGLLVPVIHHAEAMDVWQLAAEIARLSAAARAGKSDRKELVGSTITVTSLGALGGLMATPIINPPEVAIIGINRIAERPVAASGQVVVRKMMNLSSSFDHRIVDGHQAAAFIAEVRRYLEEPAQLA